MRLGDGTRPRHRLEQFAPTYHSTSYLGRRADGNWLLSRMAGCASPTGGRSPPAVSLLQIDGNVAAVHVSNPGYSDAGTRFDHEPAGRQRELPDLCNRL